MEQWQQDNRRDVVMVDIDQLVPNKEKDGAYLKLKIALAECEEIDVYKSAQYTVGEWMDM